VAPIDSALIEQWAGSKRPNIANDVIAEQSRRLWRISLFQNMGAKLLQDDHQLPVAIILPSLTAPFGKENEKSYFIMFRPAKGADFPMFDLSFLDVYYDIPRSGYGSIPGYDSYLEDVVARQKSNINSHLKFERLHLTAAMRQLLRKIKFGALSDRLPDGLRELDAAIERIELKLRNITETTLAGDISRIPSNVLGEVEKRITGAVKKNAALDADLYKTLAGKLEYFDLRDPQQTIVGKGPWPQFKTRFGVKEKLEDKFDQLAELRNAIRHSRTVNDVVRKEGEAAILWFNAVLAR
jgi:hypothetical protein